ncbi:MAG: carboxypeptidase-like regulatory domain-containing protein, partial [Thermoanaerobaculia bacterium]
MTARLRSTVGMALCAALMASAGWAQSKTTAALTGTVTDESGASVPGASVEVSSPALIGGARLATTDEGGRFRFPEVAPGLYVVVVSLEGFQTVRVEGVTLVTGATNDIAVKLGVAAISETLVVTADAATVDTASSATNTNLDSDYLQNLPTSRFQPDVLNLAPGINNDVAYGSAGGGLAYQLDGVDTSDPEAGTAWSFVNYN